MTDLINRLRTESLDSAKCSVSIMDLCMKAAAALERLKQVKGRKQRMIHACPLCGKQLTLEKCKVKERWKKRKTMVRLCCSSETCVFGKILLYDTVQLAHEAAAALELLQEGIETEVKNNAHNLQF